MITLSVIIVSYNTKKVFSFCLNSLLENLKKYPFITEIIIVDNGSTDGSLEIIKKFLVNNQQSTKLKWKVIFNKKNIGFGKANNQGVKKSKGRYLLFLNSDVDLGQMNIKKLLDLFEKDIKIGVITPQLVLSDGRLDKACHRGFPNLWRTFCYLSYLETIFSRIPLLNKVFGGYHLCHKNFNQIHEIDSPSGAFYLTRKEIFEEISGFDKDFFMYGEDLDLSWRIKEKGYKIIFYPFEKATHLKYQSGLEASNLKIKRKTKQHFYEAMKIFYQKHYQKRYPFFINRLIFLIIDFLKSR